MEYKNRMYCRTLGNLCMRAPASIAIARTCEHRDVRSPGVEDLVRGGIM